MKKYKNLSEFFEAPKKEKEKVLKKVVKEANKDQRELIEKAELKNWEKATNQLVDVFIKKYFDEPEYYWIADIIGGTLVVNDYFFNIDRIVEAIKYNATDKQLFDFHEMELDFAMKNKPMKINFVNYIKYETN